MDRYRVKPGSRVDLVKWNPNDRRAFRGDGKEGRKRPLKYNREMEELQELLYAERRHKVLIALQAMDTGGKDGTIRHVFEGVNTARDKILWACGCLFSIRGVNLS